MYLRYLTCIGIIWSTFFYFFFLFYILVLPVMLQYKTLTLSWLISRFWVTVYFCEDIIVVLFVSVCVIFFSQCDNFPPGWHLLSIVLKWVTPHPLAHKPWGKCCNAFAGRNRRWIIFMKKCESFIVQVLLHFWGFPKILWSFESVFCKDFSWARLRFVFTCQGIFDWKISAHLEKKITLTDLRYVLSSVCADKNTLILN